MVKKNTHALYTKLSRSRVQNLHPTFEKSCRERRPVIGLLLANTAHRIIFQTKASYLPIPNLTTRNGMLFSSFLFAMLCGEIHFGAIFAPASSPWSDLHLRNLFVRSGGGRRPQNAVSKTTASTLKLVSKLFYSPGLG